MWGKCGEGERKKVMEKWGGRGDGEGKDRINSSEQSWRNIHMTGSLCIPLCFTLFSVWKYYMYILRHRENSGCGRPARSPSCR